MTATQLILIYLVAINVITFFVYGIDKWKARRSKWRIPESTLLGLAIVGGSIGAWLGMKTWHHKTLHKKFKYGIPLILIVQIALVILCSCRTPKSVLNQAEQHSATEQADTIPVMAEHSPDVFLVMYDAETGKEPLLKAIKDYGCEVVYDYKIINGMALKKPRSKSLEATMQHFRQVKGVLTVEYDHITRLTDPVEPRLEVK